MSRSPPPTEPIRTHRRRNPRRETDRAAPYATTRPRWRTHSTCLSPAGESLRCVLADLPERVLFARDEPEIGRPGRRRGYTKLADPRVSVSLQSRQKPDPGPVEHALAHRPLDHDFD